jgi:hypothetical protein
VLVSFLLADVVGVAWCVRTLTVEVLERRSARQAGQLPGTPSPVWEYPPGFVLVPAQWGLPAHQRARPPMRPVS